VSAWEMHDGRWEQTAENGTGTYSLFYNGEEAGTQWYRDGKFVRGAH